MKMKPEEFEAAMKMLGDESEARHLKRFFKCGPGQYGEGDRFLGIRVPVTRRLVREVRGAVSVEDAVALTGSVWHEVRLAGFLLLVELCNNSVRKRDEAERERIVKIYLGLIHRGNNWDLVDLVAPKILGEWLVGRPGSRDILDKLADRDDSLWHQRVAIVATWTLIREGQFDDTFRLARRYLDHRHDLIHKATGWMLREVGKRGGRRELTDFLDRHATEMPRTALRYAIEHFPEEERQHYLTLR